MLYKRVVLYRDLSYHVGIVDHSCLCIESRISFYCLSVLNALKSPHKIQMPGGSAELTVCDHMISQLFDLSYQITDTVIFHSCQLFFCDLSFFKIFSCLF